MNFATVVETRALSAHRGTAAHQDTSAGWFGMPRQHRIALSCPQAHMLSKHTNVHTVAVSH